MSDKLGQMDTYWQLLCLIVNDGIQKDRVESVVVKSEHLTRFMEIIEDPKWRKKNVRVSNLIHSDDPKRIEEIKLVDFLKYIKGVL